MAVRRTGWAVAALISIGGLAAGIAAHAAAQAVEAEAAPPEAAPPEAARPEVAPAEAVPAQEGGAGEDAAQDAGEEAAGADAGEAPEAIELTVVPSGVNISQSINFDEEGKVRHQNEHCSISLRCTYPDDLAPLTYRFQDVRVITSAGDRIVPQINSNESNINRRGRNDRSEFSISFSLPTVPAADSLRQIEGTVVLKVGEAPKRKAVLGPFGELQGKRLKIVEYPDTRITITDQNDRLRIQYGGPDWKLVDEVAFINGDGVTLSHDQWGGGGNDTQWHQDYRVELPEDGRVVITFWGGTREIEVPFRVNDVPMPRSLMEAGAFDLVFNARPLDQVRIPGADLEGDLEVVVE